MIRVQGLLWGSPAGGSALQVGLPRRGLGLRLADWQNACVGPSPASTCTYLGRPGK